MSYVDNTEYAACNLIELAMHEEAKLEELKVQLNQEMGRFRANKWDFETSDLHEDFSDAHVMGAFHRMAQADTEAEKLKVALFALEAEIGVKQLAVQSLCGALLQIARQGISLVHGSLNAAPDGRLVDGIALKDIVWQARNQAMHYEDEAFSPAVIALFGRLEEAFGVEFALAQHVGQCRAKQVVKLLHWTDYTAYYADMKSLEL